MKSQTGIKRPPRRQHDRAFKARLVRESMQPGASVAAIAMANGINANMLFKWRRERLSTVSYRDGVLGGFCQEA
jgi:transposase